MTATLYALGRAIVSVMENIAAKTTTFNGTAFDATDYEGDAKIIQAVGVVSGTTPTLDGKVQSSATSGGTYADIAGATFTQVTATSNVQAINVRVSEASAFLRYVGTIGGTTPSFTMGVLFVGKKKYEA